MKTKALARLEKALLAILKRVGPLLALGLVGALVTALLFAALAYNVVRGETREFDEATRQAVRGLASPGWTAFFRAATELGSPRMLVPLSLAAVAVFLFERRRRAALLLAITMLGVVALDNGVKLVFARARPVPFFGLATPVSYSFPSGHALASFCFFGSLAALLGARIRRRAVRLVVWTVATLVILAVGFSRIYLGVHYASDVLGGYAAGVVWVVAVASGDRVFRRGDRPGAVAPVAEPVARS